MDKQGSMMKSMAWMFGFMIFSMVIAGMWSKYPAISNAVHSVLDPSVGALINWNLNIGFLIFIFAISLLTTLVQKYATDQKTLRELKNEQKQVQEEMKKLKDNPEKMMEMQKEMMPLTFKIMELSMRGTILTIIPFILLFRWFMEFFASLGEPKFFGFFNWFWFYLIFVMIFSSILRKKFDVV